MEVPQSLYFSGLPSALAFRDLQRTYSALVSPDGEESTVAEALASLRANAIFGDPLDMGVMATLEGRLDDARRWFLEAAASSPESAWPHFYAGTLHDLGRQTEAAAEAYRRAVAIEASNPRFFLHLGFCELELERYDEARRCFSRVIDLNPHDSNAQGFLGYLLLAIEPARALDHLEVASTLDGANPFFALRLGEALVRTGRIDDAREPLCRAAADARSAREAHELLRAVEPPPDAVDLERQSDL